MKYNKIEKKERRNLWKKGNLPKVKYKFVSLHFVLIHISYYHMCNHFDEKINRNLIVAKQYHNWWESYPSMSLLAPMALLQDIIALSLKPVLKKRVLLNTKIPLKIFRPYFSNAGYPYHTLYTMHQRFYLSGYDYISCKHISFGS